MSKIIINVSELTEENMTELTGLISDLVGHFDVDGEVEVKSGVRKAGMDKTSRRFQCAQIYIEMKQSGQLVRKDVVERFMDEVGMTDNGAKTYYQNFRSDWSNDV